MPDPISPPANYAYHCNDVADLKLEQLSEIRKARRIKGPIYKVLLEELHQDGCYTAARHFECLVEMERKLIAKEYERYYVYEKEDFLIKIIDNIKAAEQIYRLDKKHGIYMSRRILNQVMGFVEIESFNWLTLKLYDILCEFMLKPIKHDYLAREQSTRFILKYSKYLMQQGGDEALKQATIVLPIGIEASCSESWKPDTSPEDEKYPTLHVALCSLLAEVYLIKSKQPGITRKHAIKRIQKGLKAIGQVGPMQNKSLTFKVVLGKIELLIDADRYDWALRELCLLEKSLMKLENPEFVPFQLDFLLKLGISLYNQDQAESAIDVFSKALKMCRIHDHVETEGEILLHIGQAQRRLPHGELRARLAFQLAKQHFQLYGDNKKEQKLKYMIASLKSDTIRPYLLKIIKSNAYCDFYKLRQWKNVCEPFWQVEKEYSHLTREALISISMFTIHNLHKLYNLVLNPRVTFTEGKDIEKSSSTEEKTDMLERVVANNLYMNERSAMNLASEADVEEEEYDEWISDSTDQTEGIEQSDVSQRIHYMENEKRRITSTSIASSTKSGISTFRNMWLPSETDPIICLLRDKRNII